ncbi:KAP family P-loop NTPase fold protein [Salmonella enterica subsp. enterica serovar Bareilly]|nr:NTPase KAP [Salmonella enterica]EDN6470233.1 NTPase KAP [Salmonella enterica subsp. enterica serovar Bareilly]KDR05004.1 NTPase KAP [Salmonella enterica subsp. enterica serovar Bareilly str. CFSAN000226]EIE3407881.1 NTPase KAP [Salmonella enterica subsp. enterica serovar Bareilly]EJW1292440.1 NTPase KAP [Salmonella enterica]
MWHDNETTVDYLNFGVVADACASLLKQANGEPISIGVSGGWGAGKSSLVKMIASRLESSSVKGALVEERNQEKHSFVVLTFNPWLYQDFESARSALLQIVGDEIVRLTDENKTITDKVSELWRRINLLRVAQLSGEAALTLTTGIPVGSLGKTVCKLAGWFASDDKSSNGSSDTDSLELNTSGLLKPSEPFSMPAHIQAFRDTLESILDELKITLVIFVDDLDRCLPQTAISTLESIRLLLFIRRSAFVIAADNDFIKAAVKVHFDGAGITGDVATNYFDKLIQVPLHVPRLGLNEAKVYLVLLLLERETNAGHFSKERFNHALSVIPEKLRNSWKGETINQEFLYELVEHVNALKSLMDLAQGLAALLHSSLAVNANPRLMKRFLNTVYLRDALSAPQGITLDIAALAKWHLLERCDESLAEELASRVHSDNDGRVQVLADAEAAAAGQSSLPEPFKNTPFTQQWLQLLPALGTEDLRPLLHLSRDSGTRDFGDDNMTPDSRKLRDALKVATNGHESLVELMRKIGPSQTELAMTKAWQSNSTSRTWKSSKEIVMLIECCKVYTEIGNKAVSLLDQAPLKLIGPGLIPTLGAQPWAQQLLERWKDLNELPKTTRNAIVNLGRRR